MNFSPLVRSWLMLVGIVLSTGIASGQGAFLAGADPMSSLILGIGVGASNVVLNLMKSPSDKAEEAINKNEHT